MKKFSILTAALAFLAITAQAQEKKFTEADKTKMQAILGRDFTATLSPDGYLAITTPKAVGEIKSAPRGGFSKLPGTAASVTFAAYEKAWVYKKDTKDLLKSKLGEERFKQLTAIIKSRGIAVQ